MRTRMTKAGFTLVEVLVVVLIATIVLMVLASVLGSSFEILRTGETRAQLNSNARIALEYMCDDLTSATGIPLSSDRDLNGYPDETPSPYGYDEQAYWRVADWDTNNVPVVSTSLFISEAWGDRVMTSHDSTVVVAGQQVTNRSFALPKLLRSRPDKQVAEYRSLFRLAIPAANDMPYYLASEWDRDGDGTLAPADLRNTGSANPAAANDGLGEIQGYPEVVPVGPYKETAAVIQDLFGYTDDNQGVIRVRQIPIASNITAIKFEYMHEVPVYMSRVSGNDIEIAYQDITDGSISFMPADYELGSGMDNLVPLISGWELRVIDVAYNGSNDGSGWWVDPVTNAEYGTIIWQLADQYPEGFDPNKPDGTHVTPNTLSGLGDSIGSGWGMTVFYTPTDASDEPVNGPIDRLAFVTTGISGGQTMEGGVAEMRPDMSAIHGNNYYNYSINPTGIGDFGDADGIPDGDGVPDDPVPGWWLPYVRAVRVTVVATPRQVIEERRASSGQRGSGNTVVYYRLDSPVPYADADRLQPLLNQKQDYIGAGRDVVLTKTVPVDFVYRTELITDPFSAEPGDFRRRVEHNYFAGLSITYPDPLGPDDMIRARTPVEKLREKNPLP